MESSGTESYVSVKLSRVVEKVAGLFILVLTSESDFGYDNSINGDKSWREMVD